MLTGLHILLLASYRVLAALADGSHACRDHGRYAVYDALAQNAAVTLHPLSSANAVQKMRARSASDDIPRALCPQCAQCSICREEMRPETEMLVAPHDGLHWIHALCYFQLIRSYDAAHAPHTCPCCRAAIKSPLMTPPETTPQGGPSTAANGPADPHLLFSIPVVSEPGADSAALFKYALAVYRQIMGIRAAYAYQGEIFEVVIDLAGLSTAESIIEHIIAETKNASLLDIYTAELVPPTQNMVLNEALYAMCLGRLKENQKTVSNTKKAIVHLVIAQLAFDGMRSSMSRALPLLGITKKPSAERIVRSDMRPTITAKVIANMHVTADLRIKDSSGKELHYESLSISTRSTHAVTAPEIRNGTIRMDALVSEAVAHAQTGAQAEIERKLAEQRELALQSVALVQNVDALAVASNPPLNSSEEGIVASTTITATVRTV